MSHDTSRALRAIAGDAGRLLHDGLKKHGLRRLAALARGYTAATFPPPGQVRAEADAFRVVKAQVQDPGSVPGGRISPSARASLQRFDAAYRHLTGAPGSPVSPLLRVLAASDQGLAATDALAH